MVFGELNSFDNYVNKKIFEAFLFFRLKRVNTIQLLPVTFESKTMSSRDRLF